MSAARSVTATYAAQYQLTLVVLPANPGGVPGGVSNISGGTTGTFYDSGSVVNLTAATPVTDGAGKQWRFTAWSGDATGSTSPAAVTMSAARSVTATYTAQYQLTLVVLPANPGGVPGGVSNISGGTTGTFYDSGSVVNLTAATPVTDGAGKQWRFTAWSGDATGSTSPAAVTMSAADLVTATYTAQYQLTLVVLPANPGGVPGGVSNISGGTTGTFYDSGSVVNLTAATPVTDGAGKRWRFDNWSGDASGGRHP